MPIFTYVAKDLLGVEHKGEVESVDEKSAASILRRKKLIIISLKGHVESGQSLFDRFFNRVSFADVVVMTRQLATMIEAGLVLSESMDLLADEQSNLNLKRVVE